MQPVLKFGSLVFIFKTSLCQVYFQNPRLDRVFPLVFHRCFHLVTYAMDYDLIKPGKTKHYETFRDRHLQNSVLGVQL